MAVQLMPEAGKIALGESSHGGTPSASLLSHILIVDDENGPRQALRMLLKEDYSVYLAANVTEALEILEQEPIDIVITDLRMPERSGVDLLREVKEIDPDIQVIIFTGYGQLETAMKAVTYGAFAYMEKPFDNDAMLDVVQSAIAKHRTERERRAFERLALEASRFETLGRLVSGMMHDMGTPLTVLSSHIELLMMNPDRDDLLKRLETMKGQVHYCAEMARSTMGYLRHDGGMAKNVNLNSVVTMCLQVAAPLLREQQVTLEQNLADDLPELNSDIVLMRQAIMNIITNACQAMADGKADRKLFVTSWCEEGEVCLAIEDSGPGIAEELRESVFETFFSTKGQSGTGLGLGVVRNVMTRINGSVKLENGRQGTGACFVLRMPAVQ